MSKKRQTAVLSPQGRPSARLTTLSYDFPHGYEVARHFHHEDQLLFATKGVMTIRTDEGFWVVPPLRAVWVPGREAHSIVMSGAVLMRTLYFAPRVAKKIPRACVVLNVSPLLRELILHACEKREWRARFPREKRVVEVLLDRLEAAPSVPLQLPRPRDSRALRLAELLIKDPSDSRTLESLCREAGGSKRTLERAFLNETGMTFGRWRQQLRLLHAMRLLASGEKVTMAALESGYHSPSAFISVFKKALGSTPNRYLNDHVTTSDY